MSQTTPQVGAVGFTFTITFIESGSAIDISAATTRQIVFVLPDGTALVKTASFTTTGSDGKITWATTSAGDLSMAGQWQMQGKISGSGFAYTTQKWPFAVDGNLPAS